MIFPMKPRSNGLERGVWWGCSLGWMMAGGLEVSAQAPAFEEAARKGAAYLLSKQDVRGAIVEAGFPETATTALSGLALAALGHQPADPTPEGKGLARALEFVLSPGQQDGSGYFGSKDNSRMYGHGITTLFLAEMLGMGIDEVMDHRIRGSLSKGVELILRAQKVGKEGALQGGWRYTPTATDSDLSITVWQTMALRAAKNAGFTVPSEAIEGAVGYIKRSFKDNRERRGLATGFSYQLKEAPLWSTAAEGLLALQVCGDYDSLEVKSTADWLLQTPPKAVSSWFFYGMYYYAQGMYQRGGVYAEEAQKQVTGLLLPLQDGDGSWKSSGGNESQMRLYRTTMALLSLSVKFHYLPIYQR
jgi:hypothetical protein